MPNSFAKPSAMVALSRYTSTQQAAWNAFVSTSKNGYFMFDRRYMDYHADRFHDHSLMVHDDGGKLIAVLPANASDGTLYSHQGLSFGGFITDTGMRTVTMLTLFDELKAYARAHQLHTLVYKAIPHIYHSYPAEEDLYALHRHGAGLLKREAATVIDLSNRLPFAKGRRYNLSKAVKAGVQVTEEFNFTDFWQLETEVLKRHNTKPVHTVEEITRLAQAQPGTIRLFTARLNGHLAAGVVIYQTSALAHAQYMGASETGRDTGALDAIIAHLLDTTYTDRRYFSFGISTEQAGTVLNEGLALQKEMFGGRTVVFDTYQLNL